MGETQLGQTENGAENPGRRLGIIGLIFAFFFVFNIVGLVVSIIALTRSKQAGYRNAPAVAGIVISIVTIVIGVAVLVVVSMLADNQDALQRVCDSLAPGVYELNTGGTITCE